MWTSPSWECFKEGLKDPRKYEDRLQDFKAHLESKDKQYTLEDDLLLYFIYKRGLFNDVGEQQHAPTSMRSWLSVFKAFWKHSGRGDLNVKLPILETKINQWEKKHIVEKAAVFAVNDLIALYAYPVTPEVLVRQVYAVIAISFAARGAELHHLLWNDVMRFDNGTVSRYEVRFDRVKLTGAAVEGGFSSFITGKVE